MLQRSDLTRERLDEIAALSGIAASSDASLAASRAAVLGARPPGDLWVFGYGSLMWNPAFSYVESRIARLEGWQRSFCLPMPGGRGTPKQPGLMCGLVASGECFGLALRIAADEVDSECAILWIREMGFGGYAPTMVSVSIDETAVEALTFVAAGSRVERLSIDDQAHRIAAAVGPLGSNRDYLFRLEDTLRAAGGADPYVTALADRVRLSLSHINSAS